LVEAGLEAPAVASRPRPPRSARVDDETEDRQTGFPPFLAVGLVVLALVAAGLGGRTWWLERVTPPPPPAIANPPAFAEGPGVSYDSIPAGVTLPDGQGLLSVTGGDGSNVRVDGNDAPKPAKGKPLRMPLPPGVHLVAVGSGDHVKNRILEVRVGRATNVNLDEL
jgi:hypothetical protein